MRHLKNLIKTEFQHFYFPENVEHSPQKWGGNYCIIYNGIEI